VAAVIEVDLPCSTCQYNLRSLPFDGRCPECGDPVHQTVVRDVRFHGDAVYTARSERFREVAISSGYPVDAFMLVQDVFQKARSRHGLALAVPPATLCDEFLQFCRYYFNDEAEARDLLTEWKLASSEDVGRVVYAMVGAQMVCTSGADSPADFEGRFTLADVRVGG
jgi:uncharacterized repeat protein (TIGR04138 family)